MKFKKTILLGIFALAFCGLWFINRNAVANVSAGVSVNKARSYVADGLLRQVDASGRSQTLHYWHRQFDGETGSWREDMHYLNTAGNKVRSDATICVVGEGLYRLYADGSVIRKNDCTALPRDTEARMLAKGNRAEQRFGVTGFWRQNDEVTGLTAPALNLILNQSRADGSGGKFITELTSLSFQEILDGVLVAPVIRGAEK